ncbi:MAG: alpha/beta fold hydrolase [Alphaproteobacteria bacterium]|nr:alpha/beta fold hydrolase [Alphaproteobacteria bacterium]
MSELLHRFADLGEVRLHFVSAGQGDPVLLLHGWPQTWYEWRQVIALLASRHRLIAPDMRGLGDSSRPAAGYDKATVASDLERLMREVLNIPRYHLVGHDWGGPVAYALAVRAPGAVRTLTTIDVTMPGDGSDFSRGGQRWHHGLHREPEALMERLTEGRERLYLGYLIRLLSHRVHAIGEQDLDEYARCYAQPGGMRAGFEYYRAIPQDVAANEANRARGRLQMPVLALGGGGRGGRGLEPAQSMRAMAANVTGETVPESGHFVPEEQPGWLAERLARLFAEHRE